MTTLLWTAVRARGVLRGVVGAVASVARTPVPSFTRTMAVKPSVENIKVLRQETDLPMKLCRQALAESSNDVDAALEWLKENEEARAQLVKKQLGSRNASEGRIGVVATPNAAALVKVNCETDFVARNEDFVSMVERITDSCLNFVSRRPPSTGFVTLTREEIAELPVEGNTAQSLIEAALSTHRENLQLNEACGVHAPETCVIGTYSHNNGSYAAVVCLESASPMDTAAGEKLKETANTIAKNVVAVEPVPESGEDVLEALLKTPMVFSPGQTVADELEAGSKALGSPLKLASFVRWQK